MRSTCRRAAVVCSVVFLMILGQHAAAQVQIGTPALFFKLSPSYPGLSGSPYVAGLAVDSQGRLLIAENFASASCGGHCGNRLLSVSPAGTLNWDAPKTPILGWPAYSSDPFASNRVSIGAADRVYFQAADGWLFGLDANGDPLGSWPQAVTLPDGTGLGFAHRTPVIIDSIDGSVYMKGGVSVSFTGFPSAINAFTADGAVKWPPLGFSGGARNWGLTFGPGGNLYSVGIYDLPTLLYGVDHATGQQLSCSPAVTSYFDVIAGGSQGLFTSFGNTISSHDLISCTSTPIFVSVRSEVIVAGLASGIILAFDDAPALNLSSLIGVTAVGVERWRHDDIVPLQAINPFSIGTRFYVVGTDQNDGTLNLFVLAADTGAIELKIPETGLCLGCPITAGVDGAIYLTGTDSTSVYRVQPVCAAPTITTQPANHALTSGESTTLSVTATGTSSLTYQWYRGTSGDATSPILGATSSSLVVVASTSSSTYWVRVGSTCGTTNSITAFVTSVQPLYRTADDSYTTHQNQTLTVPALGILSNDVIDNYSLSITYTQPLGTLTITGGGFTYTPPADFVGTDRFTYFLDIANDGGRGDFTTNTSTVTIVVQPVCVTPSITSGPLSSTISAGQSATLSVTATGTALTYQWYIGISGDTSDPISGARESTLTVSPTTTSSYWVQVRDSCGVANSGTAVVSFSTGSIRGKIGFGSHIEWLLDGEGIDSIVITASKIGGTATTTAKANGAAYEIPTLVPGMYTLSANIMYEENISPSYWSCSRTPVPTITVARKTVVTLSWPATVISGSSTQVDFQIAPPISMVHGIASNWRKWESWVSAATARGFMVITPNYTDAVFSDEGDWFSAALSVHGQVEQTLKKWTTAAAASLPAWVYIGHSQGGLIARVLTADGGVFASHSLERALTHVVLLGTPNSGARVKDLLALTCYDYLSPSEVKGDFNQVYPNFGQVSVNAFAGTNGGIFPWPTKTDEVVSVDSVGHIECSGKAAGCVPLTIPTETAFYTHLELGSVESLGILTSKILPRLWRY